ncbi:MAG: MarR family winged helix-turn-helix transcriptional regulator [Acidimicrobiia bacterium]
MTSPSVSPVGTVDLTHRDDVDRLRVTVLRLARRIRTQSSDTITPSQLFTLATIARHGRLTIGRIAELEHVKPPSASKIVAALEVEGLVERAASPDDRRCTFITVTPAGRDHLERIRAAGRNWITDRLADLAEDDVHAIEAALPALERLLQVGE